MGVLFPDTRGRSEAQRAPGSPGILWGRGAGSCSPGQVGLCGEAQAVLVAEK